MTFFICISILLRFINNIFSKLELTINNFSSSLFDLFYDIFLLPNYEPCWLVLTSSGEVDKVSDGDLARESLEEDKNSDKGDPKEPLEEDKESDRNVPRESFEEVNEDGQSPESLSTRGFIHSLEVLKYDIEEVRSAKMGDTAALENLKEYHPSYFKDVSEEEGLDRLKKDLDSKYDEHLATNWSSSSEDGANSENYAYSDNDDEFNFKRKRDEDEDEEPKRRKLFRRDNDDDSNNKPGSSSGTGGFGPTSSSNESSGNNRVIYDLMGMLLLFFSSIAESFSFFISNIL